MISLNQAHTLAIIFQSIRTEQSWNIKGKNSAFFSLKSTILKIRLILKGSRSALELPRVPIKGCLHMWMWLRVVGLTLDSGLCHHLGLCGGVSGVCVAHLHQCPACLFQPPPSFEGQSSFWVQTEEVPAKPQCHRSWPLPSPAGY